MSILTRLAAQILVAILAVSSLLEQSWLLIIPVAIAIVWMINLYNFMDGMDGFAGGMAVWGFGFLSLIAYTQGAPDAALVCALIAVASTGFLLFNFPPARIFMGDAGSTLIGFFAAIAILYFHVNQLLFAGLGILIFSPFIVDATVTLLRRILKGERFWQAHRSHYYQRLVQAGWGHRNTVLAEYGLMALTGICALMVMNRPDLYWPVLTGWLLGYAAVMQVLERTVLRRA